MTAVKVTQPSNNVASNNTASGSSREFIDWHTHVWLPSQMADWDDYMPGAPASASYDLHESAMADGGVSKFLVIGLVFRQLGINVTNDFIASYVDAHEGRAIGVGCVDPNDPGAKEELERAAGLGLRGLKLSPPYQGFHPHSDAAWEIYELADRLGLFLMFHQGWVFHPKCSLKDANPILLDEVAGAFPEMKMIIAHLGAPWVWETAAVMRRRKNVLTDVSARIRRPWELYNGLMAAIDYQVIDRVVFGSDFPMISPGEGASLLRALNSRLPGAPEIPPEIIEDLITNRPLSLLDRQPAVAAGNLNDPLSSSGQECC